MITDQRNILIVPDQSCSHFIGLEPIYYYRYRCKSIKVFQLHASCTSLNFTSSVREPGEFACSRCLYRDVRSLRQKNQLIGANIRKLWNVTKKVKSPPIVEVIEMIICGVTVQTCTKFSSFELISYLIVKESSFLNYQYSWLKVATGGRKWMERSDSYFPNLIYNGSVISSTTNISAFIFCKYPTGTSYVAKLTQLNFFPSNSFVLPLTLSVSIELLCFASFSFSLSKYISNLPSKLRGHCMESNI